MNVGRSVCIPLSLSLTTLLYDPGVVGEPVFFLLSPISSLYFDSLSFY